MAISEKDLLQILDWLEKSEWQDLRLETATFKLSVSKSGRPPEEGPARSTVTVSRAADEARSAVSPPAVAAAAAPPPPAKAAPEEPADPSWVPVRSPTLGNFYVAPKPGAPPFVSLGQAVGVDDTVAIVEVMKLMNHVPAGVSGTIARVCARNGDLVEEDQTLFLIAPGEPRG